LGKAGSTLGVRVLPAILSNYRLDRQLLETGLLSHLRVQVILDGNFTTALIVDFSAHEFFYKNRGTNMTRCLFRFKFERQFIVGFPTAALKQFVFQASQSIPAD
jgi:hypothetical protein